MGRTACTEPQCLYKGALYLLFTYPSVLPTFTTRYQLLKSNIKWSLHFSSNLWDYNINLNGSWKPKNVQDQFHYKRPQLRDQNVIYKTDVKCSLIKERLKTPILVKGISITLRRAACVATLYEYSKVSRLLYYNLCQVTLAVVIFTCDTHH
jgi:hypothetical protein